MNSISALQELISFLYVSVIKTGPYSEKISEVLHNVVDVDGEEIRVSFILSNSKGYNSVT